MITFQLTSDQANLLHAAMLAGFYDIRENSEHSHEVDEMAEAVNSFYSQLCVAEGTTPSAIVSAAEDYVDSMDGDFDSGMASAGHGTDEDYGYFGEMGMSED